MFHGPRAPRESVQDAGRWLLKRLDAEFAMTFVFQKPPSCKEYLWRPAEQLRLDRELEEKLISHQDSWLEDCLQHLVGTLSWKCSSWPTIAANVDKNQGYFVRGFQDAIASEISEVRLFVLTGKLIPRGREPRTLVSLIFTFKLYFYLNVVDKKLCCCLEHLNFPTEKWWTTNFPKAPNCFWALKLFSFQGPVKTWSGFFIGGSGLNWRSHEPWQYWHVSL